MVEVVSSNASELIRNTRRYLKVFSKNYVKSVIGDSINNNRTLSVNQVLRFMNRKNAAPVLREEGRKLAVVYKVMLDNNIIQRRRARSSDRSDAFDINELFLDFAAKVDTDPKLKSKINRLMNKVV